jgi:hypothetical protein
MQTVPWLMKVMDVSEAPYERFMAEWTYEYPPATITVFGHFVLARLNKRTASLTPAAEQPPDFKLPMISAGYFTPWTATFSAP